MTNSRKPGRKKWEIAQLFQRSRMIQILSEMRIIRRIQAISGSSLIAVQAAVKLLEWGEHTGLDPEEIREAASAWLSEQTDSDREEALLKLEMVDDAYQRLLKEDARELLDTAGCADTEIFWGSEPVEPVEAIMQAAGLRKD